MGFVVRQAEMSNVDDHIGLMALLNRSAAKPAFVHPTNVKAIGNFFPGLLPDWKTVAMNHTGYRLHSAFIPRPNRIKLLEQYRSGNDRGGPQHLATSQTASRSRLGICLSCMASDFKSHGFAIWHRIHLVPAMLYCPTHEEPLMTFCPRCDLSHRRRPKTWHPRQKCLCGGPLQPIVAMRNRDSVKAAIAIAKMAEDVLVGRINTSALASNTGPVLRARAGRIAQKLDRRDSRQVAQEYLESRLGTELISALGFKARTLKRATGHWLPGEALRNPIQNIASIWGLFGGWPDFLSEVKARKANPERYDASTRIPPKRIRPARDNKYERWRRKIKRFDSAELKHYRENCRFAILAEKKCNPGFKRSEIRNLRGGQEIAFFVTHYDQQWLDKNLPSQLGRHDLPKVIERKRATDLKKKNLVLQRYEDTIRETPQRFITRTFLLSETGNETRYKRSMGTSELESALDRCADTHDSWRERQIATVTSLARKVDKESRWAVAETFDGLTRKAFSERINRARAWIEESRG